MAVKKKAAKVKKYKTLKSATKARKTAGSMTTASVSTKASRSGGGGGIVQNYKQAQGLANAVIRTINGIKVPISTGSNKKKK